MTTSSSTAYAVGSGCGSILALPFVLVGLVMAGLAVVFMGAITLIGVFILWFMGKVLGVL